MEGDTRNFYALPNEIVLMILERTSYVDCNSFMRTCKRFYDLISSSSSLWNEIYFKTVGKAINIPSSQSEVNGLNELRQYLGLKKVLINLVGDMSPKHFNEYCREVGLENAKEIFELALSDNRSFIYTVIILQDFIQTANNKVNTFKTKRPYTLTEIYYGKNVLRYLIHVMYTLKWMHQHYTDQLTPEVVLNFFTQWLDPVQMHSDRELRDLIKNMIKEVDKTLLIKSNTGRLPGVDTKNTCPNGIYTEREVLMAISHYMYKTRHMVLITCCNKDTLDVIKTIKSNSGHGACLGAIFQAIARGFGITSFNLIAFPNHLYLEWLSVDGVQPETMQFSLDNGALKTPGRCPFSANGNPNRGIYKYDPDSFIQYLISNYLKHYNMGAQMDWYKNNAVNLLHFLSNDRSGEYFNFILYLRGLDHNTLTLPFNIENILIDHIITIKGLLSMNNIPPRRYKDVVVKHHSPVLKYSVGLLCYHKAYDYACVIRGWDITCSTDSINMSMKSTLSDGTDQPFYHVIASDRSCRYIAQEHLMLLPNPFRINYIEDAIAKEFSHFNGFFYEPNIEKQLQYPGDMAISNMYASKSFVDV